MANRIYQRPQFQLCRNSERPLFVDRESFFEFSFWISAQLNELIENHESETRIRRLHQTIEKLGNQKAK